MMKGFAEIRDPRGMLRMDEIPSAEYVDFREQINASFDPQAVHILHYFAVPAGDDLRLFCILGFDEEHVIRICSSLIKKEDALSSLTAVHPAFHVFERDLHERYGICYTDHPWLKPVRLPGEMTESDYPFYSIDSEELHEVGVGPVHAGVIEPGHFRFICHGEKVLHLEIRLGYQHRGVEALFPMRGTLLQKTILAESIAGDTAVGHATCFATLTETLAGIAVPGDLTRQRMIALELERMAVHIGDTAALCTDTAYQFGQVVCEALRTLVINTTQLWCGNRFGKGLIRTGGTRYPLNPGTAGTIRKNLEEVMERYEQITAKIFSIPSVLNRFEGTGTVTPEQAALIGAVGMAARSSGLKRDVRWSFPGSQMLKEPYEPVVFPQGDVLARGMVRREEVRKSYKIIMELLDLPDQGGYPAIPLPVSTADLAPGMLAFSLAEGWRGEICHVAVTGADGRIAHYRVKDPSVHNWLALALAVRNQEISDFPLCNKSYNLSYCGHDL